ncbi:hypothetical protein Gorai_022310, partial [Gossypium raimondii]|nr:hypothetical protein [Gossypium raimondii]
MRNVTQFILALTMAVLLPNFVVSISTKTKIDISKDQSALKALKVHVGRDSTKRNKKLDNALRSLYLDNNLFEGEIPSDMFDHLSRWQVLYLGKNKPSGKIPLGLFKCKELEDISLADNRLEGILPKEIGNLTILRSLYLDNNLF